MSTHDAPRYLRSDNGSEFVSRAVLRWPTETNIDTAHIDAGKPWQNGSNESFNGKFRDECLNMQWFKNRIDAKMLIEKCRQEYNEIRRNSSLGQFTPLQFKQTLSTTTADRFPHYTMRLAEPCDKRSPDEWTLQSSARDHANQFPLKPKLQRLPLAWRSLNGNDRNSR
ncbi:hypothetical protein GCM10011488_68380 [Steroidobacter agaridevorans]|nr:hypothetical protein GCM10011488_68380 [Steroidobacter agaridevorans]